MKVTGAPEKESPRHGLLIVLPSLMAGGAERSLVSLARQMCSRLPVALAVVRATGSLGMEIGESLSVYDLGGRLVAMWNLVQLVWRQKPLVILSTMWDMNLFVLLLKPFLPYATKIVVREAVIAVSLDRESQYPRLWRFLYRRLYHRADAVIVMTDEMKRGLQTEYDIPGGLITIIPNAVQPDRCGEVVRAHVAKKHPSQIVSMGRLVSQKGYDVLLRSFARVIREYPDARLKIYGEGPERMELQRLINVLGLREHVLLPGVVSHPAEVFGCADLYVLSSRYEGMSNAMLEALCAGIPVIAVARHTGAKEVVTDGFNGILVPDCTEDDLASGILRALREYEFLDNTAIRDDARQRFSGARFVEDYRKLFARISARKPVSEMEK